MDLFTYQAELEKEEQRKKEVEKNIFSVTELNQRIKNIIENSIDEFWVEGEISNYKRHSSGHHYFSIKDQNSVINCVLWKWVAQKNNLILKSGDKVEIYGKVTVYQIAGKYQIDVKKIKLAGLGDLQLKFEELKNKLRAEGLFDNSLKRPLPYFVKKIGVVTASTGAAFQDIRKVIRQRSPFVDIYIYNAKVQGKGAAEEIAQGIKFFNQKMPQLDLLIIGRGGGSLEDLWAFNEEVLARAIHQSEHLIISAVGHEIDFSISDFTADVRAATPSHAAEIATLDLKEELKVLELLNNKLENSITTYFKQQENLLERYQNSYALKRPLDLIKNYSMEIDNLAEKLTNLVEAKLTKEENNLNNLASLFSSLGPQQVLARGYAIIRQDKKIIDSKLKITKNKEMEIEFKDGTISGNFL